MMGDKGLRDITWLTINGDRGVRDIMCLIINENYSDGVYPNYVIKLFKMSTESDDSFFNFY